MKNATFRNLWVLIACFGCANMAFAKSTSEKIKESIDEAADSLKQGVDKCGDDMNKIQQYLDNYHWKGMIQDTATSGSATLKYLQMNGHSRVVAVKPGERIKGIVVCQLDKEKCSSLKVYRVLIGIKGLGAQTTVGNELGLVAGESLEHFEIVAPSVPGLYQVRFRTVENVLASSALKAWTDCNGNEPDGTTTIGLIYVK